MARQQRKSKEFGSSEPASMTRIATADSPEGEPTESKPLTRAEQKALFEAAEAAAEAAEGEPTEPTESKPLTRAEQKALFEAAEAAAEAADAAAKVAREAAQRKSDAIGEIAKHLGMGPFKRGSRVLRIRCREYEGGKTYFFQSPYDDQKIQEI